MKTVFKIEHLINGSWIPLGEIEASSMSMARDIALNKSPINFGELHATRRLTKGKTIYEYWNGAICVERISNNENN